MNPKTILFTCISLMLWTEGSAVLYAHVRTFHYIQSPKTWTEAQRYCRERFDDLPTIDRINHQADLVSLLGGAPGDVEWAWIGLSRSGNPSWKWSTGIGDADEPTLSTGIHNCGLMNTDGTYGSDDCDNLHPALCFNKYSGKKHYAMITERSWQDAQKYCRHKWSDMTVIEKPEEHTEVVNRSEGVPFWIGLFRDNWVWADGYGSSYRNWMRNRPNEVPGGRNCTKISRNSSEWVDEDCNAAYTFFCQGKPKFKTTLLKVKIRIKGNPNLPAERESLLRQFQTLLQERGVTDVNLAWRTDNKGNVFHREQDKNDNNDEEKTCG